MLHSLLIGPVPPSSPAVQCPSSPTVVFSHHHHRTIRPPGRPPSPSQHTKNPISLPSLTYHYPIPTPPPPSPLPLLSDSRHCCYPSADEIIFNVAPSCCSAASCRHHGSRNFPPSSYPLSFAQTSNIGQRATHSATVTCLLLIYSRISLVPSA